MGNIVINVSAEGSVEPIKIWTNEDLAYFFLPSYVNAAESQCVFSSDSESRIEIDGVAVATEENILESVSNLFDQPHQLSFVGGADQTEYNSVWFVKSASVPSVFIDTESGSTEFIHSDKGNIEQSRVRVYDENGVLCCEDTFSIKCRGNQSFIFYEKKPYSLSADHFNYLPSLGYTKKFVLLNHGDDGSYLRNVFMHDLAKKIGMSFVPRLQFCDVYVNHEYRGNYLLSQRPNININSVNIQNLSEENNKCNASEYYKNEPFGFGEDARKGISGMNSPSDISGGYLLERNYLSKYWPKESGFITVAGNPFIIRSPRYASQDEVEYISEFVDDVESAIYSQNDISMTGRALEELIDLRSFAMKYCLEEMCLNEAQGSTSSYYYKDSDFFDGKLYAGPVWDYDKSMGNHYLVRDPGLFSKLNAYPKIPNETGWFVLLYEKPKFISEVKEIYQKEVCPAIRDILNVNIPEWEEKAESSIKMDQIRWATVHTKDHREALEDMLDWLNNRLDFLDDVWIYDKDVVLIKMISQDGIEIEHLKSAFKGDTFSVPEDDDVEYWINPATSEIYEAGKDYVAERDLNLLAVDGS